MLQSTGNNVQEAIELLEENVNGDRQRAFHHTHGFVKNVIFL